MRVNVLIRGDHAIIKLKNRTEEKEAFLSQSH